MTETPTQFKTAVVTGGCSGIGLHLVQHLLTKPHWRVVVADIRPDAFTAIEPTLDSSRTLFVPTDVASWDSNAALFKQAHSWSDGRIDFFAANAGTADKESMYSAMDLEAEPAKPDLVCLDVNQIAVFYGMKLFIYYARKTQQGLKTAGGSAPFNPKMVITASCTAQYPFCVAPQYAASKHAVLGLTRAVGPVLHAQDNIAVNCILPAYLDTGLTPSTLTKAWPPEWVTPTSTTSRAFEELIDEEGKVEQDGKSDGVDGRVKVAQSVECVLDRLYYRESVPFPDESQKFLIDEAVKLDGLWWKALTGLLESGGVGVKQGGVQSV